MNICNKLVCVTLLSGMFGCAQHNHQLPLTSSKSPETLACLGTTTLPQPLQSSFIETEDSALLQSSLGEPSNGKLCQGKVYEATQDVVVFRAWNSTNPGSQFGQWWAFNRPAGLISEYRAQFEICYQWSPLDKMSRCTLKQGTKVVVGNGQSAMCSEYLTYSVSSAQQVYVANAKDNIADCTSFDGVMEWVTEQSDEAQ
ncbi:hypothetical protein NI389_19525 (plasmid) [Pseudoalteromonas xiamenensis]|uniref:hypothetical protein n=1 Tax=Pseudoalteromonas xiamenensis TaxID=882626 RepID=UPI0027E5B64D|nr:hypothetical protein [Pseudoalteromonas xiamenensis]WMN61993.1 hypothetical protein NI389_19525 [Pseudoalteromonas xiamenensis]